jgi:hypothetical protein
MTHDRGNTVSDKDWELAAHMSQFYCNRITFNKQTLTLMRWAIALGLVAGTFWLFKFYENVKLKHRMTSMDFIFQRVDMKRNDYYSHIKP